MAKSGCPRPRARTGPDMRHRPYFFARRRVRLSSNSIRRPNEGARDAKGPGASKFTPNAQTKMLGPTGLDASRHRGVSKPNCRKSAKPKASRARCLIGLLRTAPGGWTFQALPLPGVERLSTAVGPRRAWLPVTGRRHPPSRGPWRTAGAPGRLRLRPPGAPTASPMQAYSPATAPRPASEDAVQTPLV